MYYMANTAVLNAVRLTPYAYARTLPGGKTALEMVCDFADSLPEIGEFVCCTDTREVQEILPGKWKVSFRDSWSMKDVLEVCRDTAGDAEHLFYFFGDCPLLDFETALEMYANHTKYFSQYTFGEGYPYGVAPEIIKTDILPALIQLVGDEQTDISRDGIFSIIQKDINAFELETLLSPEDMRLLRVHLSCDTKRNTLLTEEVLKLGVRDAKNVIGALRENCGILRTLPAYYAVQITEGCPQSCSYCPYPAAGGDPRKKTRVMGTEEFETIVDKACGFSEDAVISPSLWGEPSLHPEIERCIRYILSKPLAVCVVETSGIGWKGDVLKSLARYAAEENRLGRIHWIVSLDSKDRKTYQELRGEGFDEAFETAELLLKLFPGQVWVQAVRMKSNEEGLEEFFRSWKEKTENVIIQKYDDFAGFLPERKVTDLSPVTRFPCWHLKRDVAVLVDGTVPLCREDLKREFSLGNILEEPLEEIWNRGEPVYREQCAERYNPLCERCDEYYTYNF